MFWDKIIDNFITTMIKRYNGGTNGTENPIYLPKQASTVFNNGCLVRGGGTGGTVRPSIAATTGSIGLITRGVTAQDANYGNSDNLKVDRITSLDLLEADVTAGTATSAMRTNAYDLNANGDGVDVTSTVNGQFLIIDVISATKVRGYLIK